MKMKRCQVNPACILTIEEPACLFPIMIFNGEEGFSFARYFQKFRGQLRPVPCPQPDADVPVMLTEPSRSACKSSLRKWPGKAMQH